MVSCNSNINIISTFLYILYVYLYINCKSFRQEEPGVNCMDISTGHLVLSYMEDHLNNTQRLEQEWVGLCAYEAEPNSTSIAFKVGLYWSRMSFENVQSRLRIRRRTDTRTNYLTTITGSS